MKNINEFQTEDLSSETVLPSGCSSSFNVSCQDDTIKHNDYYEPKENLSRKSRGVSFASKSFVAHCINDA